jgi:hypothetical protein
VKRVCLVLLEGLDRDVFRDQHDIEMIGDSTDVAAECHRSKPGDYPNERSQSVTHGVEVGLLLGGISGPKCEHDDVPDHRFLFTVGNG